MDSNKRNQTLEGDFGHDWSRRSAKWTEPRLSFWWSPLWVRSWP